MKYVYPAFIKKKEGIFRVFIPDLPKIRTFGLSFYDAINAGRDACLFWLLNAEKNGEYIPIPDFDRDLDTIEEEYSGYNAIRTFIDVNTDDYKKEFIHYLLVDYNKKGLKLVVRNDMEIIDTFTAEKTMQDSEELDLEIFDESQLLH